MRNDLEMKIATIGQCGNRKMWPTVQRHPQRRQSESLLFSLLPFISLISLLFRLIFLSRRIYVSQPPKHFRRRNATRGETRRETPLIGVALAVLRSNHLDISQRKKSCSTALLPLLPLLRLLPPTATTTTSTSTVKMMAMSTMRKFESS